MRTYSTCKYVTFNLVHVCTVFVGPCVLMNACMFARSLYVCLSVCLHVCYAKSAASQRSFPAVPQLSTVPAVKKKRSNVQLIPLSEHKSPNNNESGISTDKLF